MNRRGMTLIEMMVAMTATLLLMGVIAQVFSVFGSAISDSRSVIELDGRMRVAAWQLRSDLAGVTAPTLPPLRPDADAGYFEVIEGANNDWQSFFDADSGNGPNDPATDKRIPTTPNAIVGDTDDVLLFTTRRTDPPFLGKFLTGRYESPIAEIAWFLRPTRLNGNIATTNPVTFTLFRRQLLVVGYAGAPPFLSNRNALDQQMSSGTWATWAKLYSDFDISVRGAGDGIEGNPITYMPNTLSDLTRRESRFMHSHNYAWRTDGVGFAFKFPIDFQYSDYDGLTFEDTSREGEDVVLSNVIAFDVRVFDPTAPVLVDASTNTVVVPGDPLFAGGANASTGAYVDLGNGIATIGTSGLVPRFHSRGLTRSSLDRAGGETPVTWDTGSTHYESDGVDQDNNGVIDQGTNGIDDNSDGIVDNGLMDLNGDGDFEDAGESGELETTVPYPFPLRGIEVRLRCYDPSSRQVRQVTIRHTFVR